MRTVKARKTRCSTTAAGNKKREFSPGHTLGALKPASGVKHGPQASERAWINICMSAKADEDDSDKESAHAAATATTDDR